MRIVVFGSGFVGSALAQEFASRRHEVTAISRRLRTGLPRGVTESIGSVHDSAFLKEVVSGADVLVSALPAIAGDDGLDAAVAVLLPSAEETGARLGVVGGSAVLPLVECGPRQADTPGFPAWLLPRVEVHARALAVLDAAPEGVDWFCLVPAADFGPHQPGVRTGFYVRTPPHRSPTKKDVPCSGWRTTRSRSPTRSTPQARIALGSPSATSQGTCLRGPQGHINVLSYAAHR
jgi:putative NADH-flavin reductase